MRRLRKVKIVATLGPASSDYDTIRALFEAGADVFRLNMSHGEHSEIGERHRIIREIEKETGRPIGILADLQGPKLRVGVFDGGSAELEEGQAFRLDLDDTPGDWQEYNPDLRNGSWPFQYANDYYPDLDDTGFAAYALELSGKGKFRKNIERAAEWLVGMQSSNGGFAAFDADNTYFYLNEIPFADHGALLDPPSADVSARVLMFFGQIVDRHPELQPSMDKCLDYLSREQEEDGAWFGRWGTNYIYGTWSVLYALESIGIPAEDPRVQKAAGWLKRVQNADGGWGEDNDSYYPEYNIRGKGYRSSAVHTSWALLGLMAAGEAGSESVARGIQRLMTMQREEGYLKDPEFNAPGFPRVFHLKYYGYEKYFPLWALARYRNEVVKEQVPLNKPPHKR